MKRATILFGLSLLALAAARLSQATCVVGSGEASFSVAQMFGGFDATERFSDPCGVYQGFDVTFTAAEWTGIGIVYTWDFGDGSPIDYGRTVSHSFTGLGSSTVRLTASTTTFVRTSSLELGVMCWTESGPPQINIRVIAGAKQSPLATGPYAPYFALSGAPVTLGTIGPGAAPGATWTFDNEEPQVSFEPTISHVFSNVGWHTVGVFTKGDCWISRAYFTLYVRGYSSGVPDTLVILGAGHAGAWFTDLTLANPTPVEQFGTIATVPTPDHIDDCPGACLYFPYHLAPNGTTTVHFAPGTGAPEFVGAWYVVPDETGTLPMVAARAVRQGSAIEATLPVYHLSRLLESFVPMPGIELGPTVLIGARRSVAAHSNLLLSVLQPPGTVDLSGAMAHVEILDGSGATVGSRDFHLAFGESRIVPDVVGALGIPSLDLGQVRVTQTGGTNLLQAVLATTLESGAVTISAEDPGANGPIPDPFFDAAVVAGGGAAGPWDTELVVGDSDQVATSVQVASRVGSQSCEQWLPDSGTVSFLASGLSGCLDPAPADVYLWRSTGGPPEVAARIFDTGNPSRSADVPSIRLSEIGDPATLVFPFSAGGRLNLYLMAPGRSAAVSVHVELWSSSGNLVSSRDVVLSAFEHRLLTDVLGTSGLQAGQIRVTKTGGDGVFWGLLAALGSDGGFTITPGMNP